MSYDDCILKIEKLENGYEVEIADPESDGGYDTEWKGYAFHTAAEVSNFIAEHLDSLTPPPDADKVYADEFKRQTSDEE
jgi:hypothetical protein